MSKVDYQTIPIEGIRHSTEKAILVALPDHSEVWIPRKCLPMHIDNEIYEGMDEPRDEITVSRWFAEKEGLY